MGGTDVCTRLGITEEDFRQMMTDWCRANGLTIVKLSDVPATKKNSKKSKTAAAPAPKNGAQTNDATATKSVATPREGSISSSRTENIKPNHDVVAPTVQGVAADLACVNAATEFPAPVSLQDDAMPSTSREPIAAVVAPTQLVSPMDTTDSVTHGPSSKLDGFVQVAHKRKRVRDDDQSSVENAPTTSKPTAPVKAAQPRLPPPIVVRDRGAWPRVRALFDLKKLNFTKARTIGIGISVQPTDVESYREMTKMLDHKSIPYHSYMLQEEKPLKVVLRGLPRELDTDDILQDLKDKGLPVSCVARMLGYQRRPLSLFMVCMEKNDAAKAVFKLTTVCRIVVSVESPKKKKGITSQCHRCQLFRHGQSHCTAAYRCVKCGENHQSALCERPREQPATCANCGAAHPANYRGCPAFPKAVQRQQQKQPTRNKAPAPASTGPAARPVTQAMSFASIASGQTRQEEQAKSNVQVNTGTTNFSALLLQLSLLSDVDRRMFFALASRDVPSTSTTP